jgi:hypothetical protein
LLAAAGHFCPSFHGSDNPLREALAGVRPIPTADSPCFHPHSLVERLAPVPVGVLNLNGCCYLGIELKASVTRSTFRRDLAVTRTRRFGVLLHPSSRVRGLFSPALPQRFIAFPADPQPMQ